MSDPVASVLIVDDDEVDRYLLRRQLNQTELPLRIFEVAGGDDALEYFLEFERQSANSPISYVPLIAFLDVNMPRKNGLEFLNEFQQLSNEILSRTSVIMTFSSVRRAGEKQKAFSYDFVKGCLTKGQSDAHELRALLEPIIECVPDLAE